MSGINIDLRLRLSSAMADNQITQRLYEKMFKRFRSLNKTSLGPSMWITMLQDEVQ